jgi:hypothetical protein
MEADFSQRLGALRRYVVRHPGHLALVGHHADQPEAVALVHRAREPHHVGHVIERRPLGADVLTAHPQAGVDVDRDPNGHGP